MGVSPRFVAGILACTLGATPQVHAAAPAPELAVDPLAEAKAAHAEGQALFDTADYAGAVAAWTRAYAALPAKEPKSATYRPLILYNIAAAREKLFELRGDVAELKQAKILLERFDGSIDELYGADPATAEVERTRVREKIAALDARIAEALGPTEPEAPPEPEPAPEPVAPPRPDPTPTTEPTTADTTPLTRGRGLVIAGGVVTGLGVAAAGGLVASLVIGQRADDISGLDRADAEGRADQFARGDRANAAAIAMGIVAPVLLAGGIAMLVLGTKRRGARLGVAPALGPSGGSFALAGRF
jgi:hypothetical protein